MKRFHTICQMTTYYALIILFIIILVMFIFVAKTKSENGHYYVYQYGNYVETSYFVFLSNEILLFGFFISLSTAMLANFLFIITGGNRHPRVYSVEERHSDRFSWKLIDAFEEKIWILLDSWRKPDYEGFVQSSRQECIQKMQSACEADPREYRLKSPLRGQFSGDHFFLEKAKDIPYWRDYGFRCILTGKFSATPHGTYIRIWHRYTLKGILFLGIFLASIPLVILSFIIFSAYPFISQDIPIPGLLVVTFFVIFLLIVLGTIHDSNMIGKKKNADLIEFINLIFYYS